MARQRTKSRGHIGFSGNHEYFTLDSGDVYRAENSSYFGFAGNEKGRRVGARFESTKTAWSQGKKLIKWD